MTGVYTVPDFGPSDLMTSEREKYRAVRVDDGQTGFYEGRQFRTFREINIPAGNTLVFRVTTPVNTILQHVGLTLDGGSIRLRTLAGGTPTGTFSDPLPIIRKNTMTGGQFPAPPLPLYAAQNVIESGGTGITGGIDIDVLRLVAAGATAQQSSIGNFSDDERGVAPGTYYWVLQNFSNGAATGVFTSFWEEQP